MTLSHPHGQIYAYPYLPPRVEKILASVRRHRETTGGDLFADIVAAERSGPARGRQQRALDRLRPCRRPLAVRGAAVPGPQGARPAGADRRGARRLRRGLPRRARPLRPPVRHPDALHRVLEPGPGRRRGARTGGCTCSCSRCCAPREDEVPGRLGVGDGCVHHRHEPRGRRRAAAKRGAWGERRRQRAERAFAERFGTAPEGVWAAPGRVNVIGEHTDYNDGFVLPVALPHTTRAAIARRTDGRVALASLQGDGVVVELALADLAPGRPDGWAGLPGRCGATASATCWPAG